MHRITSMQVCTLCPRRAKLCLESLSKRTISSVFRVHSVVLQRHNLYVGQYNKLPTCMAASNSVIKPCASLSSLHYINKRNFSSSDRGEDGQEGKVQPVFVSIPNPIKLLRNKIFAWMIRSYFDADFTIDEFTNGARQALVLISQQIAEGAWENLEGLLSPKLLQEVRNTCHNFSVKELSSFSITEEEILHTFPHDITIHYDDKGGKFLFILMKFWCHSVQSGSSDPEVKGFRIGRAPPGVSEEQFKSLGSVYSCTYEFLRNVSPGASPQWTITYMQHGQLLNTESKGLPDKE